MGDRDFAGVDLSGESLRGMKLTEINLSGANLSHTDLRGTQLTNAKLVGTNFTKAKTGTRRRWFIPKLLLILTFAFFAGQFFAGIGAIIPATFFQPSQIPAINVIPIFFIGFATMAMAVQGLANSFTYPRNFWTISGIILTSSTFSLACIMAFADLHVGILTIFLSPESAYKSILISIPIPILSFIGAFTFACGKNINNNFDERVDFTSFSAVVTCMLIGIICIIPTSLKIFTFQQIPPIVALGISGALVGFAAVNFSEFLITPLGCALNSENIRGFRQDKSKKYVFESVSAYIASYGGTSFRKANLMEADFSMTTLKSANFQKSNLIRTRFYLAKKLYFSYLFNTILYDFHIFILATTLDGSQQSYHGKNLKGLNLAGANLQNTDLTEADLSSSNLEGAILKGANLTKVRAFNTRFSQANLTGACIDSWNINHTTHLKGVICDYIYLLNNQEKRCPNSGIFQPGEFTKLFQEIFDTVDLIFQNGIDWKAFLQTFRQMQVEHKGAKLAIQSIENKGDGVVVVKLNAAPNADKEGIHHVFMSGYQTALQDTEACYKAKLQAKDEQIEFHRQQSANMQEVVKLLAARPINVDVKAFAASRAMQGNDQSQNFNVQGNFSIEAHHSVVSLRDISGQVSNQIQQLPPASAADQSGLKELLAQLQAVIETDAELSEADKAEALAEIGELAKAGQAPQETAMKKLARRSLHVLRGVTASLSEASKLAAACKDLLPLVAGLFGL